MTDLIMALNAIILDPLALTMVVLIVLLIGLGAYIMAGRVD